MSLSNTTVNTLTFDQGSGDLIADFGHPHFPGWMLIMTLLVLTIAAQSMMSPNTAIIRPRPSRPAITRLVRRPDGSQ
ncbi:hypothetical protein [Thalassospira sp. B30-1]|jgi:hypothetical protein|uniref:hypothetical protein n=1 Tax=Thalassospira sp. B30-1 TaxID=2785911 RepID=UPI0018CB0EB8|nr:hypothetical protein [Thalassospira sp. B30-1]QPL37227.1 hypothetical protein IT971_08060 [Thalassospira sp. B30-1]